jgi:hypothetical protein
MHRTTQKSIFQHILIRLFPILQHNFRAQSDSGMIFCIHNCCTCSMSPMWIFLFFCFFESCPLGNHFLGVMNRASDIFTSPKIIGYKAAPSPVCTMNVEFLFVHRCYNEIFKRYGCVSCFVCVWMYIHICIYIYIYIYLSMCLSIYNIHIYIYIYIYTYILYIYIYIYPYMATCFLSCLRAPKNFLDPGIYMYVYRHVYAYVYFRVSYIYHHF